MNLRSFSFSKSHFLLCLSSVFILFSCSGNGNSQKLLKPEQLTSKQTEIIHGKDFLNKDENLVYIYTNSKLTEEGVILTDNKIIFYDAQTVEKEILENIFDLSINHSQSKEKESRITVYRKDDTEFSTSFAGGTDIDENFFSELKKRWREAITAAQRISDNKS